MFYFKVDDFWIKYICLCNKSSYSEIGYELKSPFKQSLFYWNTKFYISDRKKCSHCIEKSSITEALLYKRYFEKINFFKFSIFNEEEKLIDDEILNKYIPRINRILQFANKFNWIFQDIINFIHYFPILSILDENGIIEHSYNSKRINFIILPTNDFIYKKDLNITKLTPDEYNCIYNYRTTSNDDIVKTKLMLQKNETFIYENIT